MKKMVFYTILTILLGACTTVPTYETRYLASDTTTAIIYTYDANQQLLPADTLIRGTQVLANTDECVKINQVEYVQILLNDSAYYVPEESAVSHLHEVVQEDSIFVRTPASIIDDTVTSHISGLAEKAKAYKVIGFDRIFPDGNVNRYRIQGEKCEGYLYAKYTVRTKAEAEMQYKPEVHAKARNTFGGGLATECDYFPVEKPHFIENIMPEACYSLYLNISPNVIGKIDEYIALAKQTKINTFVIDIKDNECPGYKADAMAKYSPTNYKWGGANKAKMYEYAVQRLKEEGFYVIGRITCFKDTYFVRDNPQCAITQRSTGKPFYHNKAYWPSAFDRQVWQFNVELAKEAVTRFGFQEINFDYVRFPDRMQKVEDSIDYHNHYNESKVQAIQRFVQYACDELHTLKVYVSIDVFGESANRGYTTPYGQYWPAISNVADVMCGMPYPDHFASGYGGMKKPWNQPYNTLLTWGKSVQGRQSETPSPARVRTWIQAYPVMRYVDSLGISYNAREVEQEIRGLYDAGLTDGYITWLSSSNLKRYQSLAPAFSIDYLAEEQKLTNF